MTCYDLSLVGKTNKAVAAKRWQSYTRISFRPGEKISDRFLARRINTTFCTREDKSWNGTLQMLTVACGADALERLRVLEWHKSGLGRCEDNAHLSF